MREIIRHVPVPLGVVGEKIVCARGRFTRDDFGLDAMSLKLPLNHHQEIAGTRVGILLNVDQLEFVFLEFYRTDLNTCASHNQKGGNGCYGKTNERGWFHESYIRFWGSECQDMTHTTVKSVDVLGRISEASAMDSPQKHETEQESILDMIRRIGDQAMEETKRDLQATASDPKETSNTRSHESRREMAAQSILRDGLASSIEEARKMVDEAI